MKHNLESTDLLITEDHVSESIVSPHMLFNQASKLSFKTKAEVTADSCVSPEPRETPIYSGSAWFGEIAKSHSGYVFSDKEHSLPGSYHAGSEQHLFLNGLSTGHKEKQTRGVAVLS